MGADSAGLVVAVLAVMVSLFALAFTLYQTWLSRHSAALQYNYEINRYLNDVLLEIADRPHIHEQIWRRESGEAPAHDNGEVHVLLQALVVVVTLALEASRHPPHYATDKADWEAYAAYLFSESAAVRNEVREHRDWWPVMAAELDKYLAGQVSTGGTGQVDHSRSGVRTD